MQGKIIKGIAGFYYIYAENDEIYECKAVNAGHSVCLSGSSLEGIVMQSKGNIQKR